MDSIWRVALQSSVVIIEHDHNDHNFDDHS